MVCHAHWCSLMKRDRKIETKLRTQLNKTTFISCGHDWNALNISSGKSEEVNSLAFIRQ